MVKSVKSEKKDRLINLRINKDDYKRIKEHAKALGLGAGTWMRLLALREVQSGK